MTKKYWYKFYMGECPVCGSDCSYKKRMYGPKPQNKEDRYEWLPAHYCYDNCMGRW
jgi:hypothetical protein